MLFPVRLTSSLHKSVAKDSPGIRVPVIGNGLDQVTIRGAHTDPERGITLVVGRSIRQDESRGRLANPGVVRNRTEAKSRAHGSVDGADGDGSEGREKLAVGVHGDGVLLACWCVLRG